MNVLSLFDGMSCGQIALNRCGIKYDKYYASEIKKHAIQLTQHHYPNTIQLGDIRNIKGTDLPPIDLLIGGSPCQDFSRGNKERKGLEGEKSNLFFEYLRLLNECKPKYFLLENVVMDMKDNHFISKELGVYPIFINSSLVSAQNRERYYWTNIKGTGVDLFDNSFIKQPEDKEIFLQDILTSGFSEKNKSMCLKTKWASSINNIEYVIKRYNSTGMLDIVFNSSDFDYKKGIRFYNRDEIEMLQTIPMGYTNILIENKALDLIGDGWTIDVICHIFNEGIKMKQFKVAECQI